MIYLTHALTHHPSTHNLYNLYIRPCRVSHIETVLKLVGTSEDLLVERFRIMWPEGGAAELASILALKVGLRLALGWDMVGVQGGSIIIRACPAVY